MSTDEESSLPAEATKNQVLAQAIAKRAEALKHLTCLECGEFSFDQYMVHNALWRVAVPEVRGHLHFRCLETRLARVLTVEDFTPAPINEPIRMGFRMGLIAKPRERGSVTRPRSMLCAECGEDCSTDYYKAKNEVWAEAIRAAETGSTRGFLHLRCLSIRLNRPLVVEDFVEGVPINTLLFEGNKMPRPVSPLPYSRQRTERNGVKAHRIAIDFDEVIATRRGQKWRGADRYNVVPVDGVFPLIRQLIDQGDQVIVYSCRLSDPRAWIGMLAWFQAKELGEFYVAQLNFWTEPGKPWADLYIDDRAYRFDPASPPTVNQLETLIDSE